MPGPDDAAANDELLDTIEHEAQDDDEKNDSRVILDALRSNRRALAGDSGLPPEVDRQLTDRVRMEAVKRSSQIQGGAQSSEQAEALLEPQEKPIPWWLVILWVIAIGAAIALWYLMNP